VQRTAEILYAKIILIYLLHEKLIVLQNILGLNKKKIKTKQNNQHFKLQQSKHDFMQAIELENDDCLAQ